VGSLIGIVCGCHAWSGGDLDHVLVEGIASDRGGPVLFPWRSRLSFVGAEAPVGMDENFEKRGRKDEHEKESRR